MNRLYACCCFWVLALLVMSTTPKPSPIYNIEVKDIVGNDIQLSRYKGKVLLIVNVASNCGYTNQYADLQALYDEYKDQGLVILGFPANNFLNQEPGDNAKIHHFCTSRFNVTFPMFSKLSVKGKDQHPLYSYLTKKQENGRLNAPVMWNFQKFLVNRNGKVVQAFGSGKRVTNQKVKRAILRQL